MTRRELSKCGAEVRERQYVLDHLLYQRPGRPAQLRRRHPERHAVEVRLRITHLPIALDGSREGFGNRIVGDVRATPDVRDDRAPQHVTKLLPDLVEVVRLVAHLSSLTERHGDRKVNSAREGAAPSAGRRRKRAEAHGREARKPDASVASGGKRLPMRLTLPVCSSGSEPLGTMRSALPSLGR